MKDQPKDKCFEKTEHFNKSKISMPFGKDSKVVTSCGCFPLSSSIQSSNPDPEQKDSTATGGSDI